MCNENIIIVVILAVIVLLGIRGSVKHFRGEGGCCGGGSSKPAKKKLKKVVKTYYFAVEGMHCENCANSVVRAVNDIDGASAKVSLHKKEAKVACDREIDPENVIQAIERRGYRATLTRA